MHKRQVFKETVDRLAAVEQMAAMSLPIGSIEEMKRQSMLPLSDSALWASFKPRSSNCSTERR